MMSEHDHAIADIRRDVIDEVARSMPGASAQSVVNAIVRRLDQGLPRLVEVDVYMTGANQ